MVWFGWQKNSIQTFQYGKDSIFAGLIRGKVKELVKTGALNLFILGLFLIAVAKEKLEDERSFYLKTKALAGGFAGAIIYVVIKPFINLFGNSPMEVSGQEVALAMLFVHLITYYLQKITGEEA